jgi:GNAT superfamily N-acetyltransferase
VPGIAKVHVDVWNSAYTGIVPQDFLDSRTYENQIPKWQRIVGEAKPRSHVYVAVTETNEVVGFTSGGESRDAKYPFDGELYAIYLLTSHQGTGAGRRLFDATINQLIADGFKSMMVWVLEENHTRKFYEKMGGIACGEKMEDIGGKPLKELAYAWKELPANNNGITTKELVPSLLPALEQFFRAEKCSGCWCMNHRLKSGEVVEGEPARLALITQVRAGRVSGILAFDGERPIGWCAFDRIADLPGLDCGYPVSERQRNDFWSIHCLAVLSMYPKEEVIEQMVRAALLVMKREGAKMIESYPPLTLPSDNSFSGTIPIFERQGFELKDKVSKFYSRMVKSVETNHG